MPIDYSEYHPKWTLISRLIRFKRAKNRCEWCGVRNHSIIKRMPNGAYRYATKKERERIQLDMNLAACKESTSLKFLGFTKVILTVAHLDQDKHNNRFYNLAALCQRCHLGHDARQHARNRKYGRNHKRDQINIPFTAHFDGEPSKELLQLVQTMVNKAYDKVKKK